MSKACAIMALFMTLMVSAFPSKADKALSEVSFLFNGYQLLIPVTINGGADTLHFLFDSGCEVNVLSMSVAKKLGLSQENEAGVSGWSKGMLMIPKASAQSLKVGSTSIPYPEFYLQDLGNTVMNGVLVDGIIGYSLLKTYAVQIDFNRRKLSLYRSSKMVYPPGGERFTLGMNYKTPTLQAAVTLPDGNRLSSTYHLITGGNFGILFNEAYVKKYGLNTLLKTTGSVTRQDLVAPVTYTECVVPYLTLQRYKMASVVALYSPKINDNAPDKEIAGAIGASVWEKYTVIINLPRQELYLLPATK